MSIKYDQINGSYAKPKYECDELESFGKDIGRSLANLLEKWKFDEDGNKKSILRRISTKSKSFLLPKKKKQKPEVALEEEEDAEYRINQVEKEIPSRSKRINHRIQVPLAPPALTSAAPFVKAIGESNLKSLSLPVFSCQKSFELESNSRQNLLPMILYVAK